MSAVLLDTHVLLWVAAGSPRLSAATRSTIDDPAHEVVFSVVSIWEVVVKAALGRADFRVEARQLRDSALAAGLKELPLRGHHVLGVSRLPALHADPFDRALLAQAQEEGMLLLTADAAVLAYGEPARPA